MAECDVNRCVPIHLPQLRKNIGKAIEPLTKVGSCKFKKDYTQIIVEARYHLIKVILQIQDHDCKKSVIRTKEDMLRQIFVYDYETRLEEVKTDHIRKEWSSQQKNMALLQESLFRKNRLLSLHSRYCSSQGNALSSVIALLLEKNEVIEMFLTKAVKDLINFVKIADGSLASFIRTYASEVPIEDSTDYRFVFSLYQCIAYISAIQNGCLFIIRKEEGQTFIYQLIQCISRITYYTCQTLKIELLKIICNISMEEEGVAFLQHCQDLLYTLNLCIMQEYDVQTFKLLLEILNQLSKDIPSTQYLNDFLNSINMERIKELKEGNYKGMHEMPSKILRNVENASTYVKEKETAIKIQDVPERLCPKKPSSQSKLRVQHVFKLHGALSHITKSNTGSSVSFSTSTTNTASTTYNKALCFSPCKDMFELQRFPLSYPVYPSQSSICSRKSTKSSWSRGSNTLGRSSDTYPSGSGSTTSYAKKSSQKGFKRTGRKTSKMKVKCSSNTSSTSTNKINKKSSKIKKESSCRKKHKKASSSSFAKHEMSRSSCLYCKSEQLISTKSYSSPVVQKPKCSNHATSCNFMELEPITKGTGSTSSVSNADDKKPIVIEEIIYVDSYSEPLSGNDKKGSGMNSSGTKMECSEAEHENTQIVPWSAANRQLIDMKKTKRKYKTSCGTVRIVSRIVDVKPGCAQRVTTRLRLPNMDLSQTRAYTRTSQT